MRKIIPFLFILLPTAACAAPQKAVKIGSAVYAAQKTRVLKARVPVVKFPIKKGVKK